MTRNQRRQFVICVSNEGYPVSLEPRKIYEQLPDPRSEEKGLIRIAADEDDDEALFPAKFFLPIALTQEIEAAVGYLAEPEAAHRRS